MASRQTIARLSERIESLAEALSRANRKTHYVLVGAPEAEQRDACADRRIKELVSSGRAQGRQFLHHPLGEHAMRGNHRRAWRWPV